MTKVALARQRSKTAELVGQVFGRFTILAAAGHNRHHHPLVRVRCSCPDQTVLIVGRRDVLSGKSTSCGCARAETLRSIFTKHGQTGSRTYEIWNAMLQRCANPNNEAWKYYGGRGIRVCRRWRRFENFLADMGEAPPDRSIDRINNAGNYEPRNCRWATKREQSLNTRRNRRITLYGQTLTLDEWATTAGIDRNTLASRLNRGVSAAEAIKPELRRHWITFRGKTLTLTEWAEQTGVDRHTLKSRLEAGVPIADALKPELRRRRRITFRGQTLTLAEWAVKTGLHRTTIASRLKSGCPVAEALGYSKEGLSAK